MVLLGELTKKYGENPNITYFKKLYVHKTPLDVYFHNQYIVHGTKTYYNKIYSPHLGLNYVISIASVVYRSAYISFQYDHTSCMSLELLQHSYT